MKKKMKYKPATAHQRAFVDSLVRTTLEGSHFRASVAARKKLPKRFSGKTGFLFLPEYQDIDVSKESYERWRMEQKAKGK